MSVPKSHHTMVMQQSSFMNRVDHDQHHNEVPTAKTPSPLIRIKGTIVSRLKLLWYFFGLVGLFQLWHHLRISSDLDILSSVDYDDIPFFKRGLFHMHYFSETFPVSFANRTRIRQSLSAKVTRETHPLLWQKFESERRGVSGTNSTSLGDSKSMPMISVVVQLRGEMANHMSAIAHARGIQLYALETFGIETNLVFIPQYDARPQKGGSNVPATTNTGATTSEIIDINPKGWPTRETLHQCFPTIQQWNIISDVSDKTSLLHPEVFQQRKQKQKDIFREWTASFASVSSSSPLQSTDVVITRTQNKTSLPYTGTDSLIISVEDTLDWINGRRPKIKELRKPPFGDIVRLPVAATHLRLSLQVVCRLVLDWEHQQIDFDESNWTTRTHGISEAKSISSPFLYSNSLDIWWFVDRYYEEFRSLFSFWSHEAGRTFGLVDSSCCSQVPYPDESVFHFRNFESEMTQLASALGFDDVTPNQTAYVLFDHLQPGDRVAITTRMHGRSLLKQHVEALRQRGIQVRVVSTAGRNRQSGMLDFCFLAHAQKEFIGNVRSTYAVWAALLGNARHVHLYTVDSPGLRRRFFNGIVDTPSDMAANSETNWRHFHFPWSHPELKHRIHFRLIPYDDNRSRKQE